MPLKTIFATVKSKPFFSRLYWEDYYARSSESKEVIRFAQLLGETRRLADLAFKCRSSSPCSITVVFFLAQIPLTALTVHTADERTLNSWNSRLGLYGHL